MSERKFFDTLPRIYCISLINAFARRRKMSKLFKKLGIENRIEYVYARPNDQVDEIRCSCRVIFNHIDIYKKCIKDEVPYACIFEDDANLVRDISENDVKDLEKFLLTFNSWNVLSLGYDESKYKKGDKWSDCICRFQGLHSHAYIISKNGMEDFLNRYRAPIHPIHIGVIDSYFLLNDEIYAFDKPLFIQEEFVEKRLVNNPVKFWIYYLANYAYWNRFDFLLLALIILVLRAFG
jgi:GR25 family glycosyltransferase involved in LPS biosynthesis